MLDQNKRPLSFSLTAIALLVAMAAAQETTARPSDPQLGSRVFGIGAEQSLWREGRAIAGGGADYRIRFDSGAMTFTPALGRRAPRTMPLTIECDSIRRGAVEIVAPVAPVDPDLAGESHVVYRHGEVLERYEVRAEGVEQSFVFPTRPAGTGDLVVRLRLTTELESSLSGASDDPDGFELRLPGIGGVRFGGVTGVDASGRAVAGTLRHDDGVVELALPGAFVDSARYPLVLDPLLGTLFEAGVNGYAEDDSDVAYFEGTDEYLFVYVREFSQTDTEIRAQRVDGTSNMKLQAFLRLTNTPSNTYNIEPAVACVATTGRFLVAWQESASPLGPWAIHCCSVDAGTGAFSATVPVTSGPGSCHSPDVGGERQADDEAIVVWDDDSAGIFAAQVNVNAAGSPPSVFASGIVRLAAGAGAARGRPAISKSGGPTGRYLVAFETSNGLGAQAFDRQLNLLGGNIFLVSSSGRERTMPDVDGDGTSFVVAYAEDAAAPGMSRDIYCQPAAVDSAGSRWDGGREAVAASAGVDEFEPAIGFLGPKYAVAWTRESSTFLRSSVQVMSIDPQSCVACGFTSRLTSTSAAERFPSIGSKWAGGSTSDQCMITFSSYDITTQLGDVLARSFAALGPGGLVQTETPSCGQGGQLSIVGPFAFANTVDIELNGADPGSNLAVLNIGLTGTTITSCGPCQFLTPIAALPASISNGRATLPLRLPCMLGLRGSQIRLQYLVTPTTARPCLGIGVSMSNIERATFGI